MSKHVTALYRTHAAATEVKRTIDALGNGVHHADIVPDDPTPLAPGSHRSDNHVNAIDRYNLPDDDQRTYKRAVRNGDYVVTVKVDDDAQLDAVAEAMRHPEYGIDIDAYDAEYRAHPDYAADVERERALAAREGLTTRDTTRTDAYARTYY